jgi:hypothetical protein
MVTLAGRPGWYASTQSNGSPAPVEDRANGVAVIGVRSCRPLVRSAAQFDYKLRSPLLPGGDLVSAVLNRQLMGLADRGGGSGLVGRRWADLCAEWATGQIGNLAQIPQGGGEPFPIERVARLDDMPRIAAVASKRGLQNPDLVTIGHRHGHSVLQAADAKFSVETARSKQVSVEVVVALLTLGSLVRSLTGELTS